MEHVFPARLRPCSLPIDPAAAETMDFLPPGRSDIASAYQAAGIGLPWLPISLDPAATWRGLLALVPAISIFLALLSLEKR